MIPGDKQLQLCSLVFFANKINGLVRVIYLMLNLVRRSFILYPTADYD